MANVNEQPMHREHSEAMLEQRIAKFRKAINENQPIQLATIADAYALHGLLHGMLDAIEEIGIPTSTRKGFLTPLEGYFN